MMNPQPSQLHIGNPLFDWEQEHWDSWALPQLAGTGPVPNYVGITVPRLDLCVLRNGWWGPLWYIYFEVGILAETNRNRLIIEPRNNSIRYEVPVLPAASSAVLAPAITTPVTRALLQQNGFARFTGSLQLTNVQRIDMRRRKPLVLRVLAVQGTGTLPGSVPEPAVGGFSMAPPANAAVAAALASARATMVLPQADPEPVPLAERRRGRIGLRTSASPPNED